MFQLAFTPNLGGNPVLFCDTALYDGLLIAYLENVLLELVLLIEDALFDGVPELEAVEDEETDPPTFYLSLNYIF